jgi:hypothetical protein
MDSEQSEAASTTSAATVRPDQEGGSSDRPKTADQAESLTGPALVRFGCTRNAAYHEDMESFYAKWHRFLMFVVVVVGTLSAGASLARDSRTATIGTAIAVLAGLTDLLWNVDGMARLHSTLRRRCFDLLARLEADESLAGIKAEFVRIVADEPPGLNAVNALAFNAAVDALGRPPDQKYKLNWWQSTLRHWIRFQPNQFRTIGQTRLRT